MHKALRILFFFLFTLFAYVQLNDVDPWLWVSGYMLIGLTSLLSLFITPKRFVFMGLFGIYGIWTITILPEFINWLSLGMPSIVGEMKAESPYIEFARARRGSRAWSLRVEPATPRSLACLGG